jgi:hypothetical protein
MVDLIKTINIRHQNESALKEANEMELNKTNNRFVFMGLGGYSVEYYA